MNEKSRFFFTGNKKREQQNVRTAESRGSESSTMVANGIADFGLQIAE
jgi:hypothetical protein